MIVTEAIPRRLSFLLGEKEATRAGERFRPLARRDTGPAARTPGGVPARHEGVARAAAPGRAEAGTARPPVPARCRRQCPGARRGGGVPRVALRRLQVGAGR